jgi:hypothetical protein
MSLVTDHQDRASIFRQAVTYVHDQAGEADVLRVFGDPKPLDEAWELALEEFKQVLRERIREGLKAERGAA